MSDDDGVQVASRVLETHHETIADLCGAGRAVAASWQDVTVTDATQVTEPLARQFEETALPERLLDVLETAVEATSTQMQGRPVPAPPYLVVTSRGPVCRVTLDDGRRLVLLFELFAVERRPREYRFRNPSPSTCLRVRIRDR